MHSPAEMPDPFAMDNAHLENSAFFARRQVIEHKVLYLAGLKRMQIQHAINRKLDRLVHTP
jgi:hypothetical protein